MTEVPLNWTVHIQCVNCEENFTVHNVDPSTQLLPGTTSDRARMILITVPNECPECHNIRLVKSEEKPICQPKPSS